MGRKNKRKIRGTSANDELTGNKRRNLIWGYEGDDYIKSGEGKDKVWGGAGDDYIESGEGKDKVWGGEGDDTIVAAQGKGYVKVMDMQIGDKIDFCGCTSTVIEMKGDDAWMRNSKSSDVYAVVKGVDAYMLNLDFANREITMSPTYVV